LFKPHEYGDVIIPFLVLRRLDCLIEPQKDEVVELYNSLKDEIENVEKRISEDVEMKQVIQGNNSEDVKQEFFDKLLREIFVDYTGERLDFYKKVMDKKVFSYLKSSMYKNYEQNFNRPHV